MDNINYTDTIQRNDSVLQSRIDNDTIIYSDFNNSFYGLNITGSRIWEILEHPIKVKELISQLINEFDCTYEEISPEVIEFLTPLYEKGLIKKL